MKKIDEIMELLTDEINGFQKSIEKLEDLSKSLNEVKVKADTSKMEYHLKEHLRKQERVESQNQQALKELNQKLKGVKLIPKWLLVLFLSALIILSIAIGYLSFQVVQLNRDKMVIHGKEEVEQSQK
jgi:cell division protein FtsL